VKQAVNAGLTGFSGLKNDGFILKIFRLGKRPVVVAGGDSDTGTMYAIFDLVEQLGVTFRLSGDIIPERQSSLSAPPLNLRKEPAIEQRRFLSEAHRASVAMLSFEDWSKLFDQMAKMKYNYLLDCAESREVLQRRLPKPVVHTSQQPVERSLLRLLGDFTIVGLARREDEAGLRRPVSDRVPHASVDASQSWIAGRTRESVSTQAHLGCIPLIKRLLLKLSSLRGHCAHEMGVQRQQELPNGGEPPHIAVAAGCIPGKA
jgi:hypothetical protein